jgi:post-segregation antitoxin (ccd killing protein)
MPSGLNALTQKGNVVLYLDKELVEKSKELGFNLSKTFENHLKQLITNISTDYTQNNAESKMNKNVRLAGPGLPTKRSESPYSKSCEVRHYAWYTDEPHETLNAINEDRASSQRAQT